MIRDRLDPNVRTAANRMASDLARPATTALALRLRARAKQLANEGMQPDEIIEAISREAQNVRVRVLANGSTDTHTETPPIQVRAGGRETKF